MRTVCVLMAALAGSPADGGERLVIDAFDALGNWRHKPNVTLSLADGTFAVRIDFAKWRYGWFRKEHRQPLDLRPYEGLAFRLRGGAGCELLVHLMTDTSITPPRTYVTGRPIKLAGESWRTYYVAWFEMASQRDSAPLTPEELSHVQWVNFSVVRHEGGSAALAMDDVRAVRLPDTVKRDKLERTSYRRPIAGEAAFFGLLDHDRFPALKPVRDALPDYAKAKTELLRYIRGRRGPAYYFEPTKTDALASAMRKVSPTYPAAVGRAADNMLTHEYTWEGETRQLTRPFDYRQKGRQWSAVLNRFGFLTNPARAWWFTRDERYAEEVVGQLCEWARSCPVPFAGTAGRTWQPLEVGCRAHAWLRQYLSVLESQSLTPEANYAILKSLAEHANVLSDPELDMGLPNMVIVESTALAGLAMLLPEFRDSARWLARGLAVLDEELRRRVLGDGAWEEVTPGYHSWVAHSCLGFSILAQRNKVALPDGVGRRFRAMYDWLVKIAKPNGHTPMLGDASDSHVDLVMTEPALFFRDPEFKHFARQTLPVHLLELFGADAVATYDAIGKGEPRWRSTLLSDCKLAVMRTGYGPDDSYLLFDFGPIWSHTHQDTLGFELHAAGQTLLWDSGICQYDMPEARTYYHQARAHNVVLVDDADMKLAGEPKLCAWHTSDTHDVVDAEATFTAPDVTHRRQVLFVKPRVWVIRDVLHSDRPHRYERLFHVRHRAEVQIAGDVATARDGTGPTLTIRSVRPTATRVETAKGLLTFHHGRGPGNSNLTAAVVKLVTDAPAGAVDLVTVLTVGTAEKPGPTLTADGTAIRIESTGAVTRVPLGDLRNGRPPPLRIP